VRHTPLPSAGRHIILSRFRDVTVCRKDMDWILDLLTNLYTPLGTTSNYSATADLHTLHITTAPAKPFPACCALTSRSLATASNSGDSSASSAQILLSQPHPTELSSTVNSTTAPSLLSLLCRAQLNTGTRSTLLVTFRNEPHRKHRFHCYSPTISRPLHAYPMPRELVYRALP
jgi:hypothetical protein